MTQYNEGQWEAIVDLHSAWAYLGGISEALRFMEEKFGVVNTHVIDFRKNILPKAYNRISEAQALMAKTGASDVVTKRLQEKDESRDL